MTYLSICAGIEAASVAWHPLGWRPVGFSEIEPFPSAVLSHHYPDVPNLGDMTRYHEWPDSLRPDLVVGGTPCQAFSVAGLRKGLADPRGNLTLVFLGILERFRPKWVVWENVPGVLSDGTGAFGSLLGGLAKLGYGFAYRILDAQYAGVPQRRRRVFVVGYLGDWRRAAAVLFEPESLRGDPPPRRESREGVAPTLSARPSGGGGLGTDFDLDGGLVQAAISPTVSAKWAKGSGGPSGDECQNLLAVAPPLTRNPYGDHESREGLLVTHSLRGEGFDASEDGTGRGTPLVPVTAFDCKASGRNGFAVGDVAPTLRSMGHKDSHQNAGGQVAVAFNLRGRDGGAMPEVDPDGLACQRAASGGSSRSYVAAWDESLNVREDGIGALTRGGDGGPHHGVMTGTAVRRLTPRECERLQGFPDDYTLIPWRGRPADQCPDGPRYKALGNSMAVPVMRWIGERIDALT